MDVLDTRQERIESSKEERDMAMLCHVLGIFTGFLGPLIIWIMKKDESKYIDEHGKEALNFEITMLIATIVSFILCFVLIGFILIIIVPILTIVYSILAGMAANRGEMYEYPFVIRFIK